MAFQITDSQSKPPSKLEFPGDSEIIADLKSVAAKSKIRTPADPLCHDRRLEKF